MIGFIDSGIGGVFVLKKCLKLCPNFHYIYLADNKNLPFGNKSKKRLIKIAFKNCQTLILKGCTTIVFACNTLTAAAISACRKKFPFIFFIGIEPAIKPAIKACKKTVVILTRATFKYSMLCKKYRKQKNVLFLPQKHLAKQIEKNQNVCLDKIFKNKTPESVVLGCTHYNFIENQICTHFSLSKNQIFEASDGVAKRLLSLNLKEEEEKIEFIFTGDDSKKERYFSFLNS